MNQPRFKVGDRVVRPEYLGNKVGTIKNVRYEAPFYPGMDKNLDECPFVYEFKEPEFISGAWDYQLVLEEVYNSPLYKALQED